MSKHESTRMSLLRFCPFKAPWRTSPDEARCDGRNCQIYITASKDEKIMGCSVSIIAQFFKEVLKGIGDE